jgi:hypothetical protein
MLRRRIVSSSSTKKRYAVIEVSSSSSSSSSRPLKGGGGAKNPSGGKDGEEEVSVVVVVRRAIEIREEKDPNGKHVDACERVKNVLFDARATTAIGEMLFGGASSSSSTSALGEKSSASSLKKSSSSFLRACREEKRRMERESSGKAGSSSEEKNANGGGGGEEENDDGRGFAFLLRRKNFATGNEYWTIVAKAYRDLSKREETKEKSVNNKKKTTKEDIDTKISEDTSKKPTTFSSGADSTTTPIKTRSFRIDDPSEDPSGAEAKERAIQFSLSRAFNEWLHDQPIAKNPRRAGLGGSRKRAMKHPCAYTGEMGEDFIDCACGDNEEYGFMLACETCGAWEHGECCGVKSEEAIPEGYACSTCVKERTAKSFPKQLVVVLEEGDELEEDVKKKNKKDAFNDNSEVSEEENEALVQEMIKNGEIIEDDDWGLQSSVAKSLGIDSKREFVLPPNSQSSNLFSAKRRCVCCVCGCEHTDEIESMVKACNCVGGGAIAHRDCLEEWESEDKGNVKSKNGDKKDSATENKGGESKKTKMVDGIIVDVIDDTSLPVTPSGTRSWKVLDDFPAKKCRACCGFGGLACGGIKDAKEGEAIIQNQKRVLAEATAMYEANAKTMRGNRPGAAKVKEEDASGGNAENEPTKEKKRSGGKGGGSPSKKEKKTSDRPPKLLTNKQDKKPPTAKGTTLIAPSSVNGVSVKKEKKKVLHQNSSGTNKTTSSVSTHIPLKKRRLMMFEEDSRNGMYKQH